MRFTRHCRRGRFGFARAFALAELLIVIGIIALLVSILLPTLARARYEAKVTTCANNERQFMNCILMYSGENGGFLPRFDGYMGAGNAHDYPLAWHELFSGTYKIPDRMFFCPMQSDAAVARLATDGFIIQGYQFWIPRSPGNGVLFPPDPPGSGPFVAVGNDPVRCPIRQGEPTKNASGLPIAQTNPVVTDDVILQTQFVGNPATFEVRTAPLSDFYPDWSGHILRGRMDSINECFIDGHVERLAPSAIKIRYLSGNAWNCW